MVALSVILNFYQIFSSEQAARKLRNLVALTASVWRDGRPEEIPVRDIVPGDLLPTDAALETAATLSFDEAALTGKSLPVEQQSGVRTSRGCRAG